MYFSREQIEQSIRQLDRVDPFFGTTFLAFKKRMLLVGNPNASLPMTDSEQILEKFLQQYYRPDPQFSSFYIPFKTWNRTGKGWTSIVSYADSLTTRTHRTFGDVLIYQNQGDNWAWQSDYIDALKKHLDNYRIPALHLAVWLFRSHSWEENVQTQDVIEAFFTEFNITPEERKLFDLNIQLMITRGFEAHPMSTDEFLETVGFPMESATLHLVKLRGVGPVQREMEFAPSARLNLITGDNGLGKSFLLECSWWALTELWAGYPAYPREDASGEASSITFQIGRIRDESKEQTVKFDWDQLAWAEPTRREVLPGLSIFARFDGSFAVWDPAKHLLGRERRNPGHESDALTMFSRTEVWDGVRDVDQLGKVIRTASNGLLYDWVRWQEAADQSRFDELKIALYGLSPDPENDSLIPGKPTRMLDPTDTREIPTLKFPYGEVPILLCSAGIQRIVSLAYLLVWAWQEHVNVARSMQREPERSIVLLVDEVEAHLHPFWQRTIVPSLMNVVRKLAPQVQIQLIITTHSPLIMASVEPIFDEDQDNLFHLYQESGIVHLENMPFAKRGRVDKWLMSDIFGLSNPRSIEAEKAIDAAKELQMKERESKQGVSKEEVQKVSDMLLNSLAEDDDFWPRWTYFAEQRGVNL